MSERRPNPYVGPRPFEPGEKLYGRERETRELVDLLIAERIVLLHSPSGAGKTSLLQAALLPRLTQRRFAVLPIMRVNREVPAASPNRYIHSALSFLEDGLPAEDRVDERTLASLTLAEYLAQRGSRFGNADSQVLVVDQFEEVLSVDPTDRAAKEAFFTQLGEALLERRRWALIAIREDYMGGLAPYVRSVPTQLGNTFRLDLLDPLAARQAIQRPAHDMGVEFTDTAAEKLVDDLRCVQMQQPDGSMAPQLGLYIEPVQLQVVCLRLWDRLNPEATHIVETDVSAVGDVDAALAGYYAESVGAIATETGESERAIREWFDRQLITEQGIRSQVLQERERSRGLKNTAIQSFIAAHIVRADERRGTTWYELAHDRLIAPIRANNAEWFDANLSALQRQADLWHTHERQAGFLLNGKALVEAERWAKEHDSELTEVEREFLRECLDARARAERERKQNRRIRLLALGAVLLSFVALAGSVLTLTNLQRANRAERQAITEAASAKNAQATAVAEAKRANQQLQVSNSLRLATQSAFYRERSFDLALLLGVQALGLDMNTQVLGNLRESLTARPQLLTYFHGHNDNVISVAFSPDGKTLVSGSTDKTILLWDVTTRQPIGQPLTGHKAAVQSVAFSPDGKTLASGSQDGDIILWDLAMHQFVGHPLTGHTFPVWSVAFRPDGSSLAAGSCGKGEQYCQQGEVLLWDVTTRQSIAQPLTGHKGDVNSVAFSPDGRILASGGRDNNVILWDVATRQPIGTPLAGHKEAVESVAFSSDGKTLASGGLDGIICMWDVTTRQLIGQPLKGHKDAVWSVAFSPDGKTLASGSEDSTIVLWDVATRKPIGQPLIGHSGYIISIAFSPDGKLLASGGYDRTVFLWDVTTRQPIGQPLTGHKDAVESVAFSPDGKTLASGSANYSIILWDVASRKPVGQPLTGHRGRVLSVAFSPDGKTLASGSQDGDIILWDLATHQFIDHPLTGHTGTVISVAFSSDGKTLASGSADKTIILWDMDMESWKTRACYIANRNLTRAEWIQYIDPDPSTYRATCPGLPLEP